MTDGEKEQLPLASFGGRAKRVEQDELRAYLVRLDAMWASADGPVDHADAFRKRLGSRYALPEEELLDVADWVVHQNNRAVAQSLDRILEAARSAWTIGKRNGNDGLVRRMPESVQVAVNAAISRSSSGRLLGEAWAAAYCRLPDPEEAYEKAVKAVEEAAAPVVSPKNSLTTLGTIIRDMKAQQDWTIDLPGRATDVAIRLAEALWSGQESRHGGNGYRRPTQGEAETAVILSVTLVQLFLSGSVKRRT